MQFKLGYPQKHNPNLTLYLEDLPIAELTGANFSHKHRYLARQIEKVLNDNIKDFDDEHLDIMFL